MSTTRINELPAAASVSSGDYLAIDNTSGVSQKITAGQLVNVDPTLSISGRPADAKATGDAIAAEQTAREAVGAEVDELKSAFTSAIGGIEFLQWTEGEVRNSWTLLQPTQKAGWACVVAPCSPGDVFSLKGYGGDNNRLWAFADSSGNAIVLSDVIWVQDFIVLTAPENAAYLVCNTDLSKTDYPACLMKGMPVPDAIHNAQKVAPVFVEIKDGYYFDAVGGTLRQDNNYTVYRYRISLFVGGTVSGRTAVVPNSGYGIGFTDADGAFISGMTNTNTGHYDWEYNLDIPTNAEMLYISLRKASAGLWIAPECDYGVALTALAGHEPTIKVKKYSGYYYDAIGGAMYEDGGYDCIRYDVSLLNGGIINGQTAVVPNSGYGIGFTDASDKFISGATSNNTGRYDWNYNLTIPDGAAYIYISLRKENASLWIAPSMPWSVAFGNIQENIAIPKEADALSNARHIKGNAASPLTILHFSDLHADTGALARIVAQWKTYGKNIDGMICTGDITGDTAEQISSWWDASVMTCIGNHDCATYDQSTGQYNWTALSMADRDAYYIAPFEQNWGIVHTSGKSYYYKDYTSQKVRLIVIDVMLYNDNGADAEEQTAWLSNLLSDAIANALHVIIASHAPYGGSAPKNCSFSRYDQSTMPTNRDCNTPSSVIDTVGAAISSGLNFVGYLVGHTHQDNIWDADNTGKQLMYNITCAAVKQKAQWINSDQIRSITKDAYNLVTIDTANTLVKIVRGGGANMDDHMRTRKAICFNYKTGEMVGEVL